VFTARLSQFDAVKRMRGQPKTSVTLTIARPGMDKPIEITVVRDTIKVPSVKSKVIDNQYGYLRLSQFQTNSFVDLVNHLEQLQKQGVTKGLVLDLRSNPGGSLEVAVGVAGAFVNQSKPLVVYSMGRNNSNRTNYTASKEYLTLSEADNWKALQRVPVAYKTMPLVVLTDCHSASASEIVAGALQDYQRAKVLGTRSYGKGSVQTILYLDREKTSAIKLTIATYRTPKGNSVQGKGIVPDFVVPQTPEGDIAHCSYREADLDNHVVVNADEEKKTSDVNLETPEISEDFKKITPERVKELSKFIDYGSADDYQLKQALNLLKGQPVAVAKVKDKNEKAPVEKKTNDKAPDDTKVPVGKPKSDDVPVTPKK
jgi:carboxyl-terminal processing protease